MSFTVSVKSREELDLEYEKLAKSRRDYNWQIDPRKDRAVKAFIEAPVSGCTVPYDIESHISLRIKNERQLNKRGRALLAFFFYGKNVSREIMFKKIINKIKCLCLSIFPHKKVPYTVVVIRK